ncbi:unnamed protein product [Gordionus sp. m RMFG-2023]
MSYCVSIPGLLKILEIIIGIIVIVLAAYETHIRYRPGSVAYFLFTASFCLIFTTLFLLFWACAMYRRASGPWNLMELAFHVLAFILYLIASIVLIVRHYRRTFWIVAAIMGFVNTVFYGLSAIFSFIEWRRT